MSKTTITLYKEVGGVTTANKYERELVEDFLKEEKYNSTVEEFLSEYTSDDTELFEEYLLLKEIGN